MMMYSPRFSILLGTFVAWGGLAGCTSSPLPSNGTCAINSALTCGAILAGNPDAGVALGQVGYSCTGTARPDDNAKFIDGVPQGQVCADQGVAADGTSGWCCTPEADVTTCAYNAVAICPEGYGYQCRGSDRPEAFNPGITCGNGVHEDDLIDYCCQAQPRPGGCSESKGACSTLPPGLTGWQCPAGVLPRGEDFGANESRADYYYFVCGVPTPAPNPAIKTYCCFTPSPLLPGGSCVTSTEIGAQMPSCTPGRFGFACYGRESPQADYLPISCTEPPIDGTSDQGYPAKLYCCDFVASTN